MTGSSDVFAQESRSASSNTSRDGSSILIIQMEQGGRIRLQGDEEKIREFLDRCRARGIDMSLLYLSYCG